jgi:PKD repeat protein
MRRALAVLAIVAVNAAAAGAGTFRVALRGANEVVNPGDADGFGVAFVTVDGTTVSYYLWAKGIAAPTAAHIHAGRATENGGVVVNFAPVFTNPLAETWVAAGGVTVDAAVAAAIAASPGSHYVNIHNASFPGGATRGQLLGSGSAPGAAATTLNGARAVGAASDPDGHGFAGLVFDGDTVYYWVSVAAIAAPTSAHVHRGRAGENGPVMIGFTVDPVPGNGVITGAIVTSAALVGEILADPAAFYVNVHNADFPGGAVRGQLGRTETALHFPVVARNKGAGTSLFKTDVRVMSFADEDATVWAEWYPKNTGGLAGATVTTEVSVAKGGEAVLDDAPGLLFGATDRGAIRLVSLTPFLAVGNTYNDQRTAGLGTFGQFAEALPLDRGALSGALLLGSNRPKADLADFRTNLGYFNPNPVPVEVTFRVAKPDGTAVGPPTTRSFPPYANDLLLYHQIITGVPASQRNQANFLVTYTASAPVFIFSSVVDNVTDDGLHQPALPAPPPPAAAPAANQPPDGTIVAPEGDVTIAPGEAVTFAGEASDPDGDEVHVVWSFGDGAISTELSPAAHVYVDAGTYSVTFTATDTNDLADPTPATRTVTVAAPNQAPNAVIVLPAGNVAIREGEGVTFEGAASDPDGDGVTVLWDFGDGSTSTASSPGEHIYTAVGEYTVTFGATDSKDLADPTPAALTVSVGVNAAPDGIIVTPATDVTVATGQAVEFEGQVTDPDDALFSVAWDFGDGVSSGALSTAHTYLTPGTYTVMFTVTDAPGKADPTPASRVVTVIQAVTLTQLQNEIFSDICAGCHPPNGNMDLREGHTFASIVDVNSSQQPALKRVKPGDPDNSYLIRKLNGTSGITGSRMPQGGPFLSSTEIQRIRSWILLGAPNN